MINNWGLHNGEKNRIRRLTEQGLTPDRIASAMKVAPHLVHNYLATIGGESTVVDDALPVGTDAFGPMPGSEDWERLSPQAKGALTRKRNAAA
jgi:hypothetical protein